MKIKELPLKAKIYNKHKKVANVLWLITWIIFLPIVIMQLICEGLDFIINKFAGLREDIVYTIFKIIYKKEILESIKGELKDE